jgi:hypothetical protein
MEYATTQQNSVRWSHPMVHDDDEEAPHISPPEEEEEVAANDSDITITNVADTKSAVENSLLNDGIHVVKTSETAATVIQTHFRERFDRRLFFARQQHRHLSHDDVEEDNTNTEESGSQQEDEDDDEEEEPPKDWSVLIMAAFAALFAICMMVAKPLVGCCGKFMGDDKQDAAGDLTNPDQLIQNMGAEGGGGGGGPA